MVGALINLVGHYFIGLPIGVSLMFPAKMGIVGKKGLWRTPRRPPPPASFRLGPCHSTALSLSGLWTGLTICVLMQSSFFIIFLYRLDWTKASKEVCVSVPLLGLSFAFHVHYKLPSMTAQAQVRAGVQLEEEKEMSGLEGGFQTNTSWLLVRWLLKSQFDLPGSAQHQDEVSVAEAACKDLRGDGPPLGDAERPGQNISAATTTVGDILSGTQLALRRGCALLVMLIVLAAGILLSHFLSKLLK